MLGRPRWVPQQVRDRGERLLEHLLGRPAGVDHADALGPARASSLVGGGDPLEEALVFALEPVGVLARSCWRDRPGRGCDAQQQRAVGLEDRRWRSG